MDWKIRNYFNKAFKNHLTRHKDQNSCASTEIYIGIWIFCFNGKMCKFVCVSIQKWWSVHWYLQRQLVIIQSPLFIFLYVTDLKFECWRQNWLFNFQIEAARSGLQSSLLVRHPESNELYVNFDPQILTMIRETECMARLGLEIPPLARTMRAKQSEYKEHYNALQVEILL